MWIQGGVGSAWEGNELAAEQWGGSGHRLPAEGKAGLGDSRKMQWPEEGWVERESEGRGSRIPVLCIPGWHSPPHHPNPQRGQLQTEPQLTLDSGDADVTL